MTFAPKVGIPTVPKKGEVILTSGKPFNLREANARLAERAGPPPFASTIVSLPRKS